MMEANALSHTVKTESPSISYRRTNSLFRPGLVLLEKTRSPDISLSGRVNLICKPVGKVEWLVVFFIFVLFSGLNLEPAIVSKGRFRATKKIPSRGRAGALGNGNHCVGKSL